MVDLKNKNKEDEEKKSLVFISLTFFHTRRFQILGNIEKKNAEGFFEEEGNMSRVAS